MLGISHGNATIVVSAPSLRDIADTFLEGNRKHKTASRHQAVRRFRQCLARDFVLEDSTPAFGRDCEVHSTLVSRCPEVAGHLNNRFPVVFALGQGLSCGVAPFVLRSQTTPQDPTKTRGMHSVCLIVVAAEADAAWHSPKVAFVYQCFAAGVFGPLAQL